MPSNGVTRAKPYKCSGSGLSVGDPAPQQLNCPRCGRTVNVEQTSGGFVIREHQRIVKGAR